MPSSSTGNEKMNNETTSSVSPTMMSQDDIMDHEVKLCKEYNLKSDIPLQVRSSSVVSRSSPKEVEQEKEETLVEENKRKSFEGRWIVTKEYKPTKPHGRIYSSEYACKPGGIRVDDMIFGVKMAHISCTDDTEERIQSSGPNTKEALKMIVGGSLKEAHRPLTDLLKDHFNLKMDKWIDESGWRYGRPVDTQGFIASNDDKIVLSYRFTTSIFDWLTNLSMTTSEWEPDEDKIIGHAGVCSCCYGRSGSDRKPRVHTGFYNNFCTTATYLDDFIVKKLLDPNCSSKTVYVCGTSLGAAIASMAFCYLLLHVEWEKTPHKIILVTAGSPRVADPRMAKLINNRMKELRPLDKAVNCRLVYDQDVVPHVPAHIGGFYHLDKLVYITSDGDVIINPWMDDHKNFRELKAVFGSFQTAKSEVQHKNKHGIGGAGSFDNEEEENIQEKEQAEAFAKELESTALPVKCHMPYYYLTFLERLKKQCEEQQEPTLSSSSPSSPPPLTTTSQEEEDYEIEC